MTTIMEMANRRRDLIKWWEIIFVAVLKNDDHDAD